ncbi:glycoside hydrolase family 2 [candidate division KSB1 bacterium]|nr:glycoside hydrolase family 2 [candidate division KSB1 bacterium]
MFLKESILILLFLFITLAAIFAKPVSLPLAEHPRPDFMRQQWLNLNGQWRFAFDPNDTGTTESWYVKSELFDKQITVPFPWGSPLSGVEDEADVGWYARRIDIPKVWQGKRVFLVIGACDWHTTAWLNGKPLGTHQGGYTPFEFELTDHLAEGKSQTLILRVDDTPHAFKLEGKQGYGPARGIWQTVYLEARANTALKTVHVSPDIDKNIASIDLTLLEPAESTCTAKVVFLNSNLKDQTFKTTLKAGEEATRLEIPIADPRLWSPQNPFLYDISVTLTAASGSIDHIKTYFGMRKISLLKPPGLDYAYVALNNKPVYLQMALDQAYHPQGYYTFPSDAFMRDEILRSLKIGLNCMRIHVKIGIPRKLYWADKLGLLIMADVPNSWGVSDDNMRAESVYAMKQMIERDYNHPSIFSWVLFNETWGLKDEDKIYQPETQRWVADMVAQAKSLDPTRLVEDNSPCNEDHVVTDLNTWHAYLPGYAWRDYLDKIVENTYPGSPWNYAKGYSQGTEPNINSECGNVWGYKGSTGDVDWSWDYHIMINEFRRHPQIGGWLYTEHHDVVNEWNGYYRFDRSEKFTGLEELVNGMSLKDLHSPVYIASERKLCKTAKTGETISVPLFLSAMTDADYGEELFLELELYGWDDLADLKKYSTKTITIPYKPWIQEELKPVTITMPDVAAVAILAIQLTDAAGTVLHRNFTTYRVVDPAPEHFQTRVKNGVTQHLLLFPPASFTASGWSLKQWSVFDGLKINGAGSGYFEYTVELPDTLDPKAISELAFRAELSAKQLFGKDKGIELKDSDYMRGKGYHDPGANANAYPMTDETRFPSRVRIRVNGRAVNIVDLPDDPADHRGILSWHAQKKDHTLTEAGSYGYLVSCPVEKKWLKDGRLNIRLEVDEALPGGLAIYGKKFGRYAMDPTVVITMKR